MNQSGNHIQPVLSKNPVDPLIARRKLLLVLVGAFAFNLLFWEEKMGINAAIFDCFIVGAIFFLYPSAARKRGSLLVLSGHILAVVMLVILNSMVSKIAALLSIFLFAAFAEYLHRSALFAAGTVFFQFSLLIAELLELFRQVRVKTSQLKKSKRSKFLLFPLILFFVFFLVYILGNKAFASLAVNLLENIVNYIGKAFDWVSFPRLMFTLLGAYITGSLILRNKRNSIPERELSHTDKLLRERKISAKGDAKSAAQQFPGDLASLMLGKLAKSPLALKLKAKVGMMGFALLNILLLVINITDLIYVWLGKSSEGDETLTELLHEGTGILILSILMAIAVVLMFFNGNINFYKKNGTLKKLAYCWLVQNIFLVLSVFMRDYYYITHYGLAYKRIGVLFFLAVVLIGLVSVILKIANRKSNYFLFRVNGNMLVVLLIFSTIINWDVMIAKYNIRRLDTIQTDIPFLLNLSEKTIPILKANEDKLAEKAKNKVYRVRINSIEDFSGSSSSFGRSQGEDLKSFLKGKERRYLSRQARLSWLSWNYADAKAIRSIKNAGLVTESNVSR